LWLISLLLPHLEVCYNFDLPINIVKVFVNTQIYIFIFKAHFGAVSLLHVPYEGSFAVDGLDEPVCNIMLSGGTDQKVIVWKASTVSTNTALLYEV